MCSKSNCIVPSISNGKVFEVSIFYMKLLEPGHYYSKSAGIQIKCNDGFDLTKTGLYVKLSLICKTQSRTFSENIACNNGKWSITIPKCLSKINFSFSLERA